MMQSRFIDFIKEKNLITKDDAILLGVSGGIDSMTMLYLFQKAGFKIGVAHCNFNLRGEEADGDELFVKRYCLLNGIALHSIKFDTKQYAHENKLSIQVAARELRYAYFDEICKEHKYTKVAIAHNLNDVTETVLLNLTRGTGIKGLAGIKAINGNIIRPLLFVTRQEIVEFAKNNGIKFREDSSNATIKYKRNFIRHKIIPELRHLNPSVDRAIADTANHLQEVEWLVEEQLKSIRERVVSRKDNEILFSVSALNEERSAKFFLVEELAPFGFSPSTASAVVDLVNAETGKRIESATHVLYKDREFLVLTPIPEKEVSVAEIDETTEFIEDPLRMKVEVIDEPSGVVVEKDPDVAFLDYGKLSFPLTLRKWQPGDKFIPFGMKGYKKISDFLVDIKVAANQKNSVMVLVSENEIIWVVGYRIDDRYKIGANSKKVLKVTLEQ